MLQPCLIGRFGVPAVPGDALEKRSNLWEVYFTGYPQHFTLALLGRYCFLRSS